MDVCKNGCIPSRGNTANAIGCFRSLRGSFLVAVCFFPLSLLFKQSGVHAVFAAAAAAAVTGGGRIATNGWDYILFAIFQSALKL